MPKAAVIFCILLLLTLASISARAQVAPCPANLLQRYEQRESDALPWSKDDLGQAWAKRHKYFIIVGVTKIFPHEGDTKDYASADVKNVASTLCDLGYEPVPNAPDNAQLSGKRADSPTLFDAFTTLTQIGPDALLVLYYSGHGLAGSGDDDLYLPLYEAKNLEVTYSQPLSSLLNKLRDNYSGDLIVILDACFSGIATDAKFLSKVRGHDRTAVMASSSSDQYSYPIGVGSTKASAFTSDLLAVLQAPESHDGITLLEDVYAGVTIRLNKEKMPGAMTPQISNSKSQMLVAYTRDHLEQPFNNRRTFQQIVNHIAAINNIPESLIPTQVTIHDGDTLVASYTVDASTPGELVLKPKELAPKGTVIDPSNLTVTGTYHYEWMDDRQDGVPLRISGVGSKVNFNPGDFQQGFVVVAQNTRSSMP